MKNSKAFKAAVKTVKNINNPKVEPLAGRTPSAAFMAAVKAVKSM